MIANGTHRMAVRCAPAVVALLALAFANEARAARAAQTVRGALVRWQAGEVRLVPVAPSPVTGVSPDELRGALQDAAQAWNEGLRGCGAPTLTIQPVSHRWLRVAQDGENAVILRAGRWCPDNHADDSECHESWRAGITHLRQRRSDELPGRDALLAEVDVEVNAVHFRWSREGGRPGTSSLRALFTHELGHALGLDHGCDPKAAKGSAAGCDQTHSRVSAMYPNPIEPDRRQIWAPSDDELQTICARYGGMPREPRSWLPSAIATLLLALRGMARKRAAS